MIDFNPKDPDDTDDFTLDWRNRLDTGETILTATGTVVSGGVAVSSVTISTTKTIARLTGGTEGELGSVRVRITTSTGRQLDETMRFRVVTQ